MVGEPSGIKRKPTSMPRIPTPTGTPDQRLAAFVARGRRAAERVGHRFDDFVWDVTETVPGRRGRPRRQGRQSVWFDAYETVGGARVPMQEAVLDVAKAYVACSPGVGITALTTRRNAFRLIGQALEVRGLSSIADCTPGVLNDAVRLAKARYCADGAKNHGVQLELVAEFLSSNGLTRAPLSGWRHGCKAAASPVGTSGEAFERRAAAKLPSPAFLRALGLSFRTAVSDRDVLVSSVSALLMCAPERVYELLSLEEDPVTAVHTADGKRRLAVRWPGSKGRALHVKWIPAPLAPLAELALSRLHAVTAEARRIKRWYDANPTRLYLPPELEHLRGRPLLTQEEAATLIGVAPGWLPEYASKQKLELAIQPGARQGIGRCLGFAGVEKHILSHLGKNMREAGGSDYHLLMLVRWRAFVVSGSTAPSPCMFQAVRYGMIHEDLSPRRERKGILQRLGIDPERRIRGRTHSFRHFLNTLVLAGGLSPADLAEWSGRTDPRWNEAYDHVPGPVRQAPLDGLAEYILAKATGAAPGAADGA